MKKESIACCLALLCALSSLMLGSCATPAPAAQDGSMADCPVCKHNGDLACVCVHVEGDTPSCQCAGKTYYFCSEECKRDFLQHPERYVTK